MFLCPFVFVYVCLSCAKVLNKSACKERSDQECECEAQSSREQVIENSSPKCETQGSKAIERVATQC